MATVRKPFTAFDAPPTVLMVASGRWVSTARLALAFEQVGCRVEMLCPRNHPAIAARAVSRHYRWQPLSPLKSLRRAFARSEAHAIIPIDELVVGYLREMLQREPAGSLLHQRIARSLAGGEHFAGLQLSRIAFAELASELGLAVPETVAVQSPSDVLQLLVAWDLPFLLKADGTAGGSGVHVITNPSVALPVWRRLNAPLPLLRSLRRGLQFGEWDYLLSTLRTTTRGVVGQRFVHGVELTAMVVAHEGRVAACVCFEVVRTWYARGPSSVLRLVDDPRMQAMAERVCAHLGTSGFCGFDFFVEEHTRDLVLIEMNARPTQLAHLPLGSGRDLVAAYLRSVMGLTCEDRPHAADADVVALFPQEMLRDPESELLVEAFHDVPWNCPALIERALGDVPQSLRDDPRWHPSTAS